MDILINVHHLNPNVFICGHERLFTSGDKFYDQVPAVLAL